MMALIKTVIMSASCNGSCDGGDMAAVAAFTINEVDFAAFNNFGNNKSFIRRKQLSIDFTSQVHHLYVSCP